MTIQGLRDTTNFVKDQRPRNWREGILLLNPNGNMPLTGLTSLMKKRVVDDAEFNWWDKRLQDRRMTVSASINATVTTIPVTKGAFGFKDGDLIWVEQTDERLRVLGDPTDDTKLPVIRGFAGSTAASLNPATAGVNPNIRGFANANPEASLAPTGVNFDPKKRLNYTEIFRHTLEMSRTAMKTNLRTGDQVREAKREVLELHGMTMEMAFWLGFKSESIAANGHPERTLGGVFQQIQESEPQNVKNAVADHPTGVSMEALEEYLYNIFKFGSSEKFAVCGNRALLTINQIVRKNSDYNIQFGVKEFGMTVARLVCPFGEIVLKTHPLWNQMTGGDNGGTAYYGMESWMCVLDMENLKYVHLKDSDTKYQPKLETNGLDGMKSGYLSEISLELHHPVTHYLIKNLVKGIADPTS